MCGEAQRARAGSNPRLPANSQALLTFRSKGRVTFLEPQWQDRHCHACF